MSTLSDKRAQAAKEAAAKKVEKPAPKTTKKGAK